MATEREKLLEDTLRDLLDQLAGVGIFIPGEDAGQWAGTEGLSFELAEVVIGDNNYAASRGYSRDAG